MFGGGGARDPLDEPLDEEEEEEDTATTHEEGKSGLRNSEIG